MTEADNDSWNDPIWAILSNVSSMLAYWDRDLRCKFANNAYLHWFGVKGSSLFDTRLQDLLGPELFAANEPFVRGALRGELQEFERLVPGPGGKKRPSLARYIPHKAPNGKVLGFVVEVTDVTLLHDTREQLRLRVAEIENLNFELSDRKRALTIAQNLGDMGSWEWDINTDAITWSEQLYRLFGLDPTSPPPSFADHRALYAPDSWAKLRAAVKHCIDYGSSSNTSSTGGTMDGSKPVDFPGATQAARSLPSTARHKKFPPAGSRAMPPIKRCGSRIWSVALRSSEKRTAHSRAGSQGGCRGDRGSRAGP